jgi:hypothetical protein
MRPDIYPTTLNGRTYATVDQIAPLLLLLVVVSTSGKENYKFSYWRSLPNPLSAYFLIFYYFSMGSVVETIVIRELA